MLRKYIQIKQKLRVGIFHLLTEAGIFLSDVCSLYVCVHFMCRFWQWQCLFSRRRDSL